MGALRPLEIPSRKRMYAEGADGAFEILELGVPLGIDCWDDGFEGDLFRGGAAPGVYQSTASGAASAVAALDLGAVGGQCTLDPGDANAGRSDLSLGRHYTGNRFATCWWRINMRDAITSSKFEVGLTDVVSGTDAGALSAKAGNGTWNATDAVVLCRDTDDDTNLTLLAVQNGTAATSLDFSTVLALNTMYWLGVTLRGTRAAGYLMDTDGNLLERQPASAYIESAVTAATLLTPWAFVQNRSGSQRRLNIDRLKVYQFATANS